MYQHATRSYEQANYFTADPLRLVLMCYEGAISSLKLARESYLAKDYATKGRALLKAMDIIHELNASLDMQKGGEIAANLRSLYLFMTKALTEADLKRDLTVFEQVIHMLEELEGEWKALMELNARPLPKIPAGLAAPRQTHAAGSRWSA
jgi:flagellar protein FliS